MEKKIMIISLIRYKIDNKVEYGILDEEKINEVKGSIFDNYEITNNYIPLSDVDIMPPVNPTKIIALGYNYKDLIGPRKKYQEPVIFLKPPSSVITHKDIIKIPIENQKVWVEVELAIIIKTQCKNVSEDQAYNYILGYTIGNDITTENINSRDHHLARSKGWDTFCSIGPCITFNLDTSDLRMITKINGEVFQNSSTKTEF
jgi:2-keto-4-pentenoate hydratase/2-oxohepta-3-ene-1,7-dioic acid hydratase in catechol pathway